MTATLHLDKITVAYGEHVILGDLDLRVGAGELLVIVGPSGAGKSTILSLVAGFLEPNAGRVLMDGKQIPHTPSPERGMVFQDLALFPWLTVSENVAFALRLKGVPRSEREERAAQTLALVGLTGWEKARLNQLSGGMRQRVALARTLCTDPQVLLMDEPLSALDPLTRENLQDEIRALHVKAGKTTLFVTHSVEEAVYLADRIVVLSKSPARIRTDLRIELPSDRRHARSTPEFDEYRRYLNTVLRDETNVVERGMGI